MKKAPLVLAIATTILGSCTEGWNDDNKTQYMEACKDSPNASGLNEAQRKAYCTCSLDEVMKHYNTIEKVIFNKDSIAVNTALLNCRSKALQ
jgi:hypothetical protein